MIFNPNDISNARYVHAGEPCGRRKAAGQDVTQGSQACENCACAHIVQRKDGSFTVKCLAAQIERRNLEMYRGIVDFWEVNLN